MSVSISMSEMMEAGIHYGHRKSRWNPKMKQFIFGTKNNIHIIDLNKSALKFVESLAFLKEQASLGKTILFAGTKPQAALIIEKTAKECGMPYVVNRWLGGCLTNFGTIKTRLRALRDLEEKKSTGGFDSYTKKERLDIDKDIDKMNSSLGGIKDLKKIPDILFIADVRSDHIAIKEARNLGIKLVGLVDTNNNPDLLDYIIPANDDSIDSLEYVFTKAKEAILEGKANPKQEKAEVKKEEKVEKKEVAAVVVDKKPIEKKEVEKKEDKKSVAKKEVKKEAEKSK